MREKRFYCRKNAFVKTFFLLESKFRNPLNSNFRSKEDNVDLSLEEEPWLAVGRDVEEHNNEGESNKGEVPEVKPDFFTTLSHNGLTQELASAVTSLDSVDNGPDDIDIPGQSGELKSHFTCRQVIQRVQKYTNNFKLFAYTDILLHFACCIYRSLS